MENFWDFKVWGGLHVFTILLLSLLCANMLKRLIKPLRGSTIPISVLGGLLIMAASGIYRAITGEVMMDTEFFGSNGTMMLEIITYHTLALGFIASTLKASKGKLSGQRTKEIFNTGVTTVATYLLQGVIGLVITIAFAALIVKDFFAGAGILLPFGYGQGSGQAMNYGNIFEIDFGFEGGKSFGLAVAALGFLSASLGGVIHLSVLKRRGRKVGAAEQSGMVGEEVEGKGEIPMQGSWDKLTVQVSLVIVTYLLTYLVLFLLGSLLQGMRALVYGFNFLIGVLLATAVKAIINSLHNKKVIGRQYINDFLMTRVSNFFFDIMVVAGIAAIRLEVLEKYWAILLFLGVVGLVITYVYNRIVAKKLFPDYTEEQFLAMYGMLTGTASTGVILLRELDGEFKTPAADNLVYQNFPAIVFGFPLMFLATLAPVKPILTTIILFAFFLVLNVVLFREQIFKRKKK